MHCIPVELSPNAQKQGYIKPSPQNSDNTIKNNELNEENLSYDRKNRTEASTLRHKHVEKDDAMTISLDEINTSQSQTKRKRKLEF